MQNRRPRDQLGRADALMSSQRAEPSPSRRVFPLVPNPRGTIAVGLFTLVPVSGDPFAKAPPAPAGGVPASIFSDDVGVVVT